MGLAHSPRIVTDGLALCLDAANSSKSAKGFKNLLNLSTWTLGTGGTTGFNQNGTTAENQRILDTGPFGVSTVVWDTPSNDATSDADGGWETNTFNIDVTKMYRFSTWVRRKVIGDGSFYIGPHSNWGATPGQYILNRSDSTENQNPYFYASGWWGNVNEWYLVVGHVWSAGSGSGSIHPDSGVYNTSGTKISNIDGDYMWASTNTYSFHRTYLFYSTNTATNQQWYQPRVDIVDGTQPTISELIAGVGSKWYDLTGNNHGNIIDSAALYNSSGYMNFDGVDDTVNLSYDLRKDFTFECWVKHNVVNTFSFLGQGPTVANQGLHIWFISNTVIRFGMYANDTDFSVGETSTSLWYHYVFTYNHSSPYTKQLYRNGVSITGTPVQAQSQYAGTGTLRIGALYSSGSAAFANGNIAAVKIYNRILTASEIQQNFNALRGRFSI